MNVELRDVYGRIVKRVEIVLLSTEEGQIQTYERN